MRAEPHEALATPRRPTPEEPLRAVDDLAASPRCCAPPRPRERESERDEDHDQDRDAEHGSRAKRRMILVGGGE